MEVTATESLAFADAHSSKNITRTTVPETQEESQADLIQRLREEKLKSATKVEEVSTKLSALQAAISAHKDDISQYCPVAWLEMQPLLTQGTELDLLGFCEEFNYEENQARVNGDDIFENGELINPENFTKALSAHEEYDESSVGILQTPEPSMVDYPERSSSGATQMHNRSLPGASKSVQKTRRAKNGRVFPCNIGRCEDTFFSRSTLCRHRKKKHFPEKLSTCGHCGKTFVSPYAFTRHSEKHRETEPHGNGGKMFDMDRVDQ